MLLLYYILVLLLLLGVGAKNQKSYILYFLQSKRRLNLNAKTFHPFDSAKWFRLKKTMSSTSGKVQDSNDIGRGCDTYH